MVDIPDVQFTSEKLRHPPTGAIDRTPSLLITPEKVTPPHEQKGVSLVLSITNTSDIIEGYRATVLGIDAAWVAAQPDVVRLMPEQAGELTLTIRLPHTYPAGKHRVSLRVEAVTATDTAWYGDLDLLVAPAQEGTLSVSPSIVTGRSRARFTLLISNQGNEPMQVAFETSDPESAVAAEFDPRQAEVAPQASKTVDMVAKARRPWFGPPAPRLIEIYATGTGKPLEQRVTFMQKAVVPVWLLTALTLLLTLLLWMLALFYGARLILNSDSTVSGPGEIMGLVTDNDQPLNGVVIHAYSPSDLTDVVKMAVSLPNSVEPDNPGQGAYKIEDLPEGAYLVEFESAEFGTIWWNEDGGASTSAGADVVIVGEDTAERADMTFNQTATVCGTVSFSLDRQDRTSATSPANRPTNADGGTQSGCSDETTDQASPATSTTTTVAPVTATRESSANDTTTTTTMPTAANESGDGGLAGHTPCPVPNYPPHERPLGQVVVTITEPPSESGAPVDATPLIPPTITDENGSYRIEPLPTPGTYVVNYDWFGVYKESKTVTLGNGDDAVLNSTLIPGPASVTGSVTTPPTSLTLSGRDETLTACAPVVELTLQPSVGGLTEPMTAVVPISKGKFEIPGLSAGAYQLKVRQTGFGPQTIAVIVVQDIPPEPLTVALAGEAGRIFGSIWDEAMGPLGGATVTVKDSSEEIVTKTDDAEAIFEFDTLPTPDRYTITFEKEGFITQVVAVNLQPGMIYEKEIILKAVSPENLSAIAGTVTNGAGAPLPGVEVTATDGKEEISVKTTSLAKDGRNVGSYEMTDLAPGSWTVTFVYRDPGDRSAPPVTVTVLQPLATGQRATVNVTLEVAPSVTASLPRLGAAGIGPFAFGRDADEVIAGLSETLGPFDEDSGTVTAIVGAYGTCPGSLVRIVRFGYLRLVFTADGDAQSFAGYRLDSSYATAVDLVSYDLQTISGLKLGDTLETARDIYTGYVLTSDVTTYTLRVTSDSDVLLHGTLDGSGRITGIYSPDACGGD